MNVLEISTPLIGLTAALYVRLMSTIILILTLDVFLAEIM
jgi:hypothetical protein